MVYHDLRSVQYAIASVGTGDKMSIALEDGARVAVLGGGPAGSLFTYFLLSFAELMEVKLDVDIYEPRDFTKPGAVGCNMCGGIVSESLIQALAIEGINLPPTVVQRGIDSYVLHTDESSLRIDTPLKEKRIAAVHRGGGPRDAKELKWGGLDGYLLGLARNLGARVVTTRVHDVSWEDGRPQLLLKDSAQTYDLLVGATGINSSAWQLYEKLGVKGKQPATTRTYITELNLGQEAISKYFGNSMHMFLLNMARLDCAAIIPKGDFVTVVLLGHDIDDALVSSFLNSQAVRRCFPDTWNPGEGICHCSPKINVAEASQPFLDRVVLVGDSGVSRLYKDGIGAAYRTAKAAARTAIFAGVSAGDFEKHYMPLYRSVAFDNRYGKFIFFVVHQIKRIRLLLRGVIEMTAREQQHQRAARRMSIVLWDMFTGSAPYRDIFLQTLDPRFTARFALESVLAIRGKRHLHGEEA